jgi:hypothetical protein
MSRITLLWVLVLSAAVMPGAAEAQKKTVTVGYLRAAMASIRDRTSVTVRGEYVSREGLVGVTGRYMRGQPFSRFSIKDPSSRKTFGSMYCEHDTDAFNTLLETSGRRVFDFHGEKGTGEVGESAIIVRKVELVTDLEAPDEDDKPGDGDGRTLRVTLTETATGNRTVLVNVVKGQVYKVADLTLVVEDE